MATGQAVQVGEAVGIIAAQSIGEPGTQLTMRTFHTGGVAGTDITQGLPRVEEIFEARKPKGLAIITEFGGVANIKDTKKKREIIVTNNETGESKAYLIPYGSRIKVMDGAVLEAGDELTEGSVNPHDILKIKGVRAVQDYMLREVQRVYRLQGVEINDKHIELIVRQMLQKVRVETNGDSDMLPGTLSGGQQQRVAIARALATKPAIILADEPTGNLDSATSHEVLGLLKMVAKQFCQTIILITHDRDIAQLADRIVHIEDGKIVSDTKEGM